LGGWTKETRLRTFPRGEGGGKEGSGPQAAVGEENYFVSPVRWGRGRKGCQVERDGRERRPFMRGVHMGPEGGTWTG